MAGRWIHAWMMDAGSADEPRGITQNMAPASRPPILDSKTAKIFYEVALEHREAGDLFLGCDAKSAENNRVITKHLDAGKLMPDELIICSQETSIPGSGRISKIKLNEQVVFAHAQACNRPRESRLHYTLTTTSANVILQATAAENDEIELVTREQKANILGEASLMPSQLSAKPADKIRYLHHEKSVKLCEEILWHYGVSSVTLQTPSPNYLRAGINLGIKILSIARNQAQKDFLHDVAVKHIMEKATVDPDFLFYLSRSNIIEQRGLEPDPIQKSHTKLVDGDGGAEEAAEDGADLEDGDDEDLDVQEEEEEEEQEEQEEEDEPEEVDAIDIDEELFGSAKGKSKAKAKQRAKAKAKVTPAPKPKGKAKATPKAATKANKRVRATDEGEEALAGKKPRSSG